MPLYLGCPLWAQKSWIGNFLPASTKPREMLRAYSRRLNTVEGNTTFYAMPSAETLMRWRDDAADGFKFCLKFPQTISHFKRLRDCESETEAFVNGLRTLGDKCGTAFLQLPPTFAARELSTLAEYLRALPRDIAVAVEPRHRDFFGAAESEFESALREHNAARCVFDTTALFSAPSDFDAATVAAQRRKPKFPVRYTRIGQIAFVRFVSHPQLSANAAHLRAWSERIAHWLNDGVTVYFFAHHPDDTFAPQVLRDLHALLLPLVRTPLDLPNWFETDESPTQPSLF